ncbi:MAG: hypothetical protein K2F80_09145, partial [Muribaculaceae bacterium]|nr:hypothetical protein [Muribaculaceae bacterium]
MLKSLTTVLKPLDACSSKLLSLFTIGLFSLNSQAAAPSHQEDKLDNCFAILAGKGITADGSVLLAHNE